MKIRSLLIKAIILPITLLFLSESYAADNDIHVNEAGLIEEETIEDSLNTDIQGIDLSINGSILNFKEENRLELKVSEMEDIPFGFVHTGKYSPEGNVLIVTEEIDHGLKTRAFRTFNKKHIVENAFVSPENFFWSASEKYVVIHNIDFYANDGSTGIMVLNVQSGQYIEIGTDQIINGQNLGKRDRLNIYNIVWLSSTKFSLIVSAGYQGYSGHPGIDYNRKVALGDDFNNKDDIVLVANWEVEIVNDNSEPIVPIAVQKSEISDILIGRWQNSHDMDSFLTISYKEMIFTSDGVITEQEEYGYFDLYHTLYHESDDTYWDITLTYLDQYHLTIYNPFRGITLEHIR